MQLPWRPKRMDLPQQAQRWSCSKYSHRNDPDRVPELCEAYNAIRLSRGRSHSAPIATILLVPLRNCATYSTIKPSKPQKAGLDQDREIFVGETDGFFYVRVPLIANNEYMHVVQIPKNHNQRRVWIPNRTNH